MNCDLVTKLIPLYFYGEVTPDEEEHLDQHLHECAACAAELEQLRAMAGALDRRKLETTPALLDECRDDLLAAIAGGAPRFLEVSKGVEPSKGVTPSKGPWRLFLEAMSATFAGFGRLRQPVGALLLIVLGYSVARFSGASSPTLSAIPADNVYPAVRDVKAETDGTVRIRFDETSHHEVTGRLEDPNIRRLILAGSHDEDAAVRVESVGLLKNRVDSQEVLDSLLNALAGDPNDGVRLKALDALKPLAGDPRVTKTMSQVLLTDANPAVRMQVIDLMVTRRDDSMVGVLQNLMQREDNNGVRLKASKVLKDWNASIGTF
jgi:hypothetical protein